MDKLIVIAKESIDYIDPTAHTISAKRKFSIVATVINPHYYALIE